jgi:hypothetical protein
MMVSEWSPVSPLHDIPLRKLQNDNKPALGVYLFLDYLIPREACENAGHSAHLTWMIRKVHVIRGKVPFRMECAPAFNYCRDEHETVFEEDTTVASEARNHTEKVSFKSKDLTMDLRYFVESDDQEVPLPKIKLEKADLERGLLGESIVSEFELEEGQTITFLMREESQREYANKEHQKVANPSEERAAELGISLKALVKGASLLRPEDDPIITKVSPAGKVCLARFNIPADSVLSTIHIGTAGQPRTRELLRAAYAHSRCVSPLSNPSTLHSKP